MLKGRKLDHIGLATQDVKADVKWYCDVLGFTLAGEFECGLPEHAYFLKMGETVYEMYQPEELPADARGKIDHIAYVSYDIEKDYADALAAGYEITTNGIEAIPTFWRNGVRYFKIKSPTGEQIEFSQTL